MRAHTTDVVHAGVAVLGSPALWHLVTSFMTGYPRFVCQFLRDHRSSAAMAAATAIRPELRHVHSSSINSEHDESDEIGALPRLAITVNDADMLRTLFQLSQHTQYVRDPALSFATATRCAVLLDRVEMLQCIAELAASDLTWRWEPSLLRVALRHDTAPHVRVLDWLVAHLPRRANPIDANDLLFHSRRGNLAVVQWLYDHGCSISQSAVDDAAQRGHAHVLQYLFQHTPARCRADAVDAVVEYGHLDVMKLLVANQKVKIGRRAVHAAIQKHSLVMLRFLVEHEVPLDARNLLDYAAYCGHLEIVEYLHASRYSAHCTANAMSKAAVHGHVEVVRFLHAHRSEGCHPETLEWAAESGQLAVVAFLLQHRCDGSVERALRLAARMDRHEIVALLCEHSPSVDVQRALADASVFGSRRALELLRAHTERKGRAHSEFTPSDATRCCERIASVG